MIIRIHLSSFNTLSFYHFDLYIWFKQTNNQKPLNNDWVTRYQPSTKTNKSILNGREIITGGSIIIPIDIKTLATAISITKNGTKIIKHIRKAVLSSLIAKAGTNVVIGISATDSGLSKFA